ncbi:DUF3995 domain-containing protein [Aliiroseovarius lamellibrachiae]|uniref:DUF3995 domain-containing protein n=1 Tax=Aliiroseovarius lamellibrachiae TaxID=1924933 RepID=UPI001BDFA531|nr:DUF3995 domain-containing protein [Aliiroseovarius lamellibrachiae]MBT2131387.1 DUF3995 domain-containing protein [Aliiroseovarius lamellibrachiae]
MTVLIVLALLGAAAVHLIWALGLNWPIRDEALLAKAVVGAKGITRMPPRWASFLVFLALLVAVALVSAQANWIKTPIPDAVLNVGCWGMILVFTLRGLAGYLPVWRRQIEPRFDHLNLRFYSPLCLFIALGTAML